MIQKGIVHIRNGMVYQGESGDRLVNRAGYRTIAEAALAQHQSSGATSQVSIVPINSIFATSTAVVEATVDAAEK